MTPLLPLRTVTLQLSVKERDTPRQRTPLEAWIVRHPRLESRGDFASALADVRDDLIRQIVDAKNRSEPRNGRLGRRTL